MQSGRNEVFLVVVLTFHALVSIAVLGNVHPLRIILDFTTCLNGDESQREPPKCFCKIRRIAEIGTRFSLPR